MIPNINIERGLISALIYEPEHIETINLKSSDFYFDFHRDVFAAMVALNEKNMPIDEEFIKQTLQKNKKFDEMKFVELLAASPISSLNAYAKSVKDSTRAAYYEQQLKELAGKDLPANEKMSKIEELNERYGRSIGELTVPTARELVESESENRPKYSTGIDFLDDVFEGGIELGQLITITGVQETGKTQLTNQILLNVIDGHKALVFPLEFNREKFKKLMQKKRHKNLHNLYVVTQDILESTSIDNIVSIVKHNYFKNGTKFIVIDSQIMLHDDSKNFNTTEEEVTSIFRKLQKVANDLDIILFVIATKNLSSSASKGRSIEIFGSKKAAHFADIQIDISFAGDDRESSERVIWIGKNKQNGVHREIDVVFDHSTLTFSADRADSDHPTKNAPQPTLIEYEV